VVRFVEDVLPVLVVILHGETTMADIDAQREVYRRWHARGAKFGLITDVRTVKIPNTSTRHALAAMASEFEEDSQKNMIAVSLVMSNKLAIGALTAIKWIMRNPAEITYHSTATAALTHIEDVARAKGIAFPIEPRALAADLDANLAKYR
jgi:hypothetical protein